ncbi:MAG: DNA mismatch repair endonuclease MutL [Pseudomonadota bacterium]
MPDQQPPRKIRQLPTQLANQIAAGEVVERPASVVKELVENSIDAHATKIVVDIEKGGHKKICIRDDGDGIAKEEIMLALSRHATSKIYSLDELESIHTMGFRGEALASISAVSQCVLTSKPKQQDSAWQAYTEGFDMNVKCQPAAHPNGTSVDVIDLFYNTPARRRFLRAQKTEFQHIEKTVKRIALAYPDISFELIHNGKNVLKLTKSDVFERIKKMFKQADANQLLDFEYANADLNIKGWISEVGQGLDTNENQYLFINQRMVKDRLLMHAIRQAYEGMLPDAKHPSFVIFLNMAPTLFDVNVHPAKHEVRFHRSRDVHNALYQAISDRLFEAIEAKNDGLGDDDVATKNSEPEVGDKINPDMVNNLENHYQSTHDYIRPPERIDTNIKTAGKDGSHKSQSTSQSLYINLQEHDTHKHDVRKHIADAQQKNAIYQALLSDVSSSIEASTSESSVEEASKAVFQQSKSNRSSQVHMPVICVGDYALLKFGNTIYMQSNAMLAHCFLLSSLTGECNDVVMQPLLMPVTVKPNHAEVDLVNEMNRCGFDVQLRNERLVLLQVPSEIKHLPWAGMFSDIIEHFSPSTSAQVSNYIYDLIAKAWCRQTAINENMIMYWLTRFDESDERWLTGAITLNEKKLKGLN